MSVIKSIVGGLIGAAIATGIYFAVKQSTGETYIWFPIVTGFLTGVLARVFSGKPNGLAVRYICGALAGLIAGVAIFGVDVVPTLLAGEAEHGPVEIKVTPRNPDVDSADEDQGADEEKDNGDESTDGSKDPAGDKQEDNEGSNESEDEKTTADNSDDESSESNQEAESTSDDKSDSDEADGINNKNQQAMNDRTRISEGSVTAADPATTERFAELIRKRSHESWFDLWMPYVFSGIGILLAYQIVRGFGSAPPKQA